MPSVSQSSSVENRTTYVICFESNSIVVVLTNHLVDARLLAHLGDVVVPDPSSHARSLRRRADSPAWVEILPFAPRH